MALLNPPFANVADKRFPTSDERANGFPCGPADQLLFNGLFHRIEAEIGAVITHAGITQSDTELDQLKDAILAMISAATGGGDPSTYLTLPQASARLPFWPEVQNADGKIGVTAPATGTVRVPGGVPFLHRGVSPYNTAQQDFATVASKTYHLRWRPVGGFVLLDLANAAYNPGGLAETNIAFDSQYDDMLVARIITNASNVATITTLVNKVHLGVEGVNAGGITSNAGDNLASRTANVSWNLSRTPIVSAYPDSIGVAYGGTSGSGNFDASQSHDHDFTLKVLSKTRYGASFQLLRDYAHNFDVAYQAIAP